MKSKILLIAMCSVLQATAVDNDVTKFKRPFSRPTILQRFAKRTTNTEATASQKMKILNEIIEDEISIISKKKLEIKKNIFAFSSAYGLAQIAFAAPAIILISPIGAAINALLAPPLFGLFLLVVGVGTKANYNDIAQGIKEIRYLQQQYLDLLSAKQERRMKLLEVFQQKPITALLKKGFQLDMAIERSAKDIVASNQKLKNKMGNEKKAIKTVKKYLEQRLKLAKYEKIEKIFEKKEAGYHKKLETIKNELKKLPKWKLHKPSSWKYKKRISLKGKYVALQVKRLAIKGYLPRLYNKYNKKNARKKIINLEQVNPTLRESTNKFYSELLAAIKTLETEAQKIKEHQLKKAEELGL